MTHQQTFTEEDRRLVQEIEQWAQSRMAIEKLEKEIAEAEEGLLALEAKRVRAVGDLVSAVNAEIGLWEKVQQHRLRLNKK